MRAVKGQKSNYNRKKSDPNLKGTFISVLLLGVFLIVSWVGVYVLFIIR